MRKIPRTLLVASLLIAGLGSMAHADTLLMQDIRQAQATAQERPSRGMSMQAVAARWGEPVARQAAVGQPPIARWDYGDFVVFFEYSHVIDAVSRRH